MRPHHGSADNRAPAYRSPATAAAGQLRASGGPLRPDHGHAEPEPPMVVSPSLDEREPEGDLMRQVIVTGGGTGIGKALAATFAQAGDQVALPDAGRARSRRQRPPLAGTSALSALTPPIRLRSRRPRPSCPRWSTSW